MKKVLVLAAAATLLATSAFAGITGSKHDLKAYGGTNTELCVFCHTPHSAATVANGPLWNRSVTNATAVYSRFSLNNVPSLTKVNTSDAPLCLSCHDGVVSETLVNEPNAGATSSGVPNITNAANLGVDLANDHPVGMNVVDNADAEIFTRNVIEAKTGMTGAISFGSGSNEMWCSSCHDVHNNANAPFLRMANTNSNLCLACHNK